jgi:hypothetical protein
MEKEKQTPTEEQVEVVETGSVEEGQVQEPAAERKPRELLYERIRTSRPDAKYDEDEEEYSRQAMSILDDLEGRAGQYDKMSEKMSARFNQNPEEAEAFLAYLDGASLPSAIRRYMGDEALVMKEGDEGWDEYQKAGKEREEQFASNRAALDQFMQNAQDSDVTMADFIAEAGLDEEGAQNFKDLVVSIANDMSAGKITKDTLMLLNRAMNYEKDVEGSREQGRVEGRNEKIEVEKKRMKGSGLPNTNASGNASEEVDVKQSNSTADWLGKFGSRK